MKNRAFFNWLIIFLGSAAIMGFCFTPALAEGVDGKSTNQFEDNNTAFEESGDELGDDSFGQDYQYTWIPCRSFTPYSSDTGYRSSGGNYRYFTSMTDPWLDAAINLPSGAYLQLARLYYYDAHAGNVIMTIYREWANDAWETLGSFTTNTSSGWGSGVATLNHTIRNGDSMYLVRVGVSAATPTLSFMGVRLYWRRQIRTGLSHPFGDIGFLPAEFQNSIAALAASGITTGTSATTYSPSNSVTRAQMAVFLARALGLYWAYPY
jgi:hypothetical protein